MTANFEEWILPLEIQANTPFTTKAFGIVDLSKRDNTAVNVVIYLRSGKNITLINGIVDEASPSSGKCHGSWRQEGTANKGKYLMDIGLNEADVTLCIAGESIAHIKIKAE